MAATYTFSNSARDRARRLLGDTGVDSSQVFLLTDEEIDAEFSAYPFNDAVASLADGLAVRFAQYPDDTTTPGGHSIKWTERVKAWTEAAKRLRAMSGPGTTNAAARLGNLTNPADTTTYGVRGIR